MKPNHETMNYLDVNRGLLTKELGEFKLFLIWINNLCKYFALGFLQHVLVN
jgi:hypothetical protein